MLRTRAQRFVSTAAGLLGLGALALTGAAGSGGCGSSTPTPRLHGQVHLTLIHTSDIHSRLFPYNLQLGQVDAGLGLGSAKQIVNIGGVARVSHIVGRERARATRVLHLDGGDCFQGAPIFNFYSGEAEVRAQSAMGTDAMLIANHEFDRGALNLGTQLQKWASFPVLAANYRFEDPSQPGASPLGAIVKPFEVFDTDGLRVAVIGMGNLSSLTSIYDSPNRLGITPLDTAEVTQFYVDLLRPQVDVIVMLTHLGLDVDERMISNTTGVDVVLGGHNHIVLQPPKQVLDCSANQEPAPDNRHYIWLNNTEDEHGKSKRYCEPRNVILAHSGAFAKYVGRLDLILSNEPKDFSAADKYLPENGFEVLTHEYQLFPVNETVPNDPIVESLLEPYHQGLDALANLDLLVGYALDGSKRNSTSGGDSALGNLISTAMWLRLGIQTDFSLTNTTGIRADLVPGAVTVEQMFNVFPFDNSITKMQLSGTEVQSLFDFTARRSSSRGCVSQVQIAGARVVIDCTAQPDISVPPGVASHIFIGTYDPVKRCASDADCPGQILGSCDVEHTTCWQPIDPIASYELATSNYLAGGGSGFRVLQRNTTQFDTGVQQRDALVDYIRAGKPCGTQADGNLKTCTKDVDCASIGEGYACACPEATIEGSACSTDPTKSCAKGQCVLAKCRTDVAQYQRDICAAAPTTSIQDQCEKQLAPCATAGEQCKFLACVNKDLGNTSDGRLRMVGQ